MNNTQTYVISEIGSNHGGELELIEQAAHEAACVGASALKTQWTSDADRMARRRGAKAYAPGYKKYLEWPESWHKEAAYFCEDAGIDYLCSVFLPEDVRVVAPHVARFKIASFEATDVEMLSAHRAPEGAKWRGKPLIISTGMMDERDMRLLDRWIQGLVSRGTPCYRLHCVSAYPAPIEELNLHLLRRDEYDGFSDHSDPAAVETGALAVAAGARIIEAHVRVEGQDRNAPDYPHAMDASQFTAYVAGIRQAEVAVGAGGPRVMQQCELAMEGYRVRA